MPPENTREMTMAEALRDAMQLAMQEDRICGRCMPVALFEAQCHAGVANAPGQVARAKVKASTGSGRLGGQNEQFHYLLALAGVDILPEIANLLCVLGHGRVVFA